ncbi:hypothetical protein ACFSCZ_11540 [Siminovitchia sediminis]|uniref:Uncharacterized protein n=1 Tax=Siminovitchia sediminis TaxID=1274353 RepID=A0ABW4KJ39_9BACI
MKTNSNLDQKIEEFPEDLAYLAKLLLREVELGRRSNAQIEELMRQEIRELVLEDIEE